MSSQVPEGWTSLSGRKYLQENGHRKLLIGPIFMKLQRNINYCWIDIGLIVPKLKLKQILRLELPYETEEDEKNGRVEK